MNILPGTLIIGVDGGGTGCRVALGTYGSGLLVELAGPRAHARSDRDEAVRNITATIGGLVFAFAAVHT